MTGRVYKSYIAFLTDKYHWVNRPESWHLYFYRYWPRFEEYVERLKDDSCAG